MIKTGFCLLALTVLAICVVHGVLRARKKTLSAELARLILTLSALPAALLLAIGISRLSAGRILSLIQAAVPALREITADAPELAGVIRAFCAAAIALILFLILYPVCAAAGQIAAKPLSRLLDRWLPDESQSSPGNHGKAKIPSAVRPVIGGICGWVFAAILLFPMAGLLRMTGDILSLPAALEKNTDPKAAALMSEFSDAGGSLPVRMIGGMGGAPVCRALTVSDAGGVRIDPEAECELLADAADYLNNPAKSKGRFSTYSGAAEKSAILNTVLPDTVETMFDRWAAGEPFMGIGAPASRGIARKIVSSGLSGLAKLDRDQLSNSMTALLDVALYLLDKGGSDHPDGLLADESRMNEIYACLIEARELRGSLRSALDAGMQSLVQKWNGAGPVILTEKFPEEAGRIRQEARTLAHATAVLVRLHDSYSLEPDGLAATLTNLGQFLDDLRKTELIGEEKVLELAGDALRSDSIRQALNLDSRQADLAAGYIVKNSENRDLAGLFGELAEKAAQGWENPGDFGV